MPEPVFYFRAVYPKHWTEKFVRLETLHALEKLAKEIKALFEATVATWEEKPVFQTKVSLAGDTPMVRVWTESELYSLVNAGSPPHFIGPRRPKGVLNIREGYRAKTRPGAVRSMPGGYYGRTYQVKGVNHPGFEGRDFGESIGRLVEPMFMEEILAAWERGVQKGMTSPAAD